MTRIVTRLGIAALAVGLTAAIAVAASTPTAVLKTRANELYPGASGSHLVWSQAPKAHPLAFTAYARKTGGRRIRLNAPGTLGLTSAGSIDGTRVVYRQHRNATTPANLKFFNLATRKRSNPPRGVNTKRQEKNASISGNWLLFTREALNPYVAKVILFNLATRQSITLDAARGRRQYASSGTVQGNYASWAKCTNVPNCDVHVYDIASKTNSAIPNPLNRSQYAASVTADGVVYFGESKNINCGSDGAIWRYPLNGTREKLLSVPRGHDIAMTSPVVANGHTTLFFDNFRCRTDRADIFKLSP
jgi:hypothetical protein